MENTKRNAKRSHGTGGKVALGAVVLALLLAGGHFGLGIGQGGGLVSGQGEQKAAQTAEETAQADKQTAAETAPKTEEAVQQAPEKTQEDPAPAAEAPQDDGVLTVTVQEDKLLYEGQEVDLARLEESLLKDYKAGTTTVELRDDHAIKAAYDEVTALLQKLSIPFTPGK